MNIKAAGLVINLSLKRFTLSSIAGAASGLSPEQSLKAFQPSPGFEVSLCAAEPVIRQPVNISFDARGRLWVVQYLAISASGGN